MQLSKTLEEILKGGMILSDADAAFKLYGGIIEAAKMLENIERKYNDLDNKIAVFYDENMPEYKEGDLGAIGEIVASHFGYL